MANIVNIVVRAIFKHRDLEGHPSSLVCACRTARAIRTVTHNRRWKYGKPETKARFNATGVDRSVFGSAIKKAQPQSPLQ